VTDPKTAAQGTEPPTWYRKVPFLRVSRNSGRVLPPRILCPGRARAVELRAPARFGCARPFGRPPASTTATRSARLGTATRSACPSGVRRARTAPMTESCRTPSRIWGVVRPAALGSTGRTTPACGPGGRHFFVVAGPWSTQLRPSQSSYYSRLVTLLRGRLLATVTGSGSSGRDQIDRLSPQPH